MKLLTLISLISLFTYISSADIDTNWCGSSSVSVCISADINNLCQLKGNINVPAYLKTIVEEKFDPNTKNPRKNIINKHEEGLLINIGDGSIPDSLKQIFKYDQDDKKVIYMPYLYIVSIDNKDDKNMQIKINIGRTFSSQELTKNLAIILTFPKDDYDTTICKCQYEMLYNKLNQNYSQRISILNIISKGLLSNVRGYVTSLQTLKTLESASSTKSTKLASDLQELKNKQDECSKYLAEKTSRLQNSTDLDKEYARIISEEKCTNLQNEINALKSEIQKIKEKVSAIDTAAIERKIKRNKDKLLSSITDMEFTIEDSIDKLFYENLKSVAKNIEKTVRLEADQALAGDKEKLKSFVTQLDKYIISIDNSKSKF